MSELKTKSIADIYQRRYYIMKYSLACPQKSQTACNTEVAVDFSKTYPKNELRASFKLLPTPSWPLKYDLF